MPREWWKEGKEKLNQDDTVFSIAVRYAQLGEKDSALDWLEKAFAERSDPMAGIKTDPRLDPLRSEPRFQTLVRRMNFPQ